MNNIHLKPTQKLIVLDKTNLFIHNEAHKALMIWHQFRPRMIGINISSLNDYYRPPLRLVSKSDGNYYFFNKFRRIDRILTEETSLRQPCLVAAESIKDIKHLAWNEVIELAFSRGIRHPEFFKALVSSAPRNIIYELMNVHHLTIANYCHFAGISQSAYEYQQCKSSNEEKVLGFPKGMSWIGRANNVTNY